MDGTSASRLTRPLNPGGRLERLSDISARSEPVFRELPGSLRVSDGKGSYASFSTTPPVGALGARRDSNPLPLRQSAQVSDLALRSPCSCIPVHRIRYRGSTLLSRGTWLTLYLDLPPKGQPGGWSPIPRPTSPSILSHRGHSGACCE